MRKKILLIISGLLFLTISLQAQIMPPFHHFLPQRNIINFQGRLLENGTPVTANKNMIFSIWTAKTGGTNLWEEKWDNTIPIPTQQVVVTNGIFNVQLGTINDLYASVFPWVGHDLINLRWIQIQVEGELLGERQPITAVPNAFNAENAVNADLLDGLDANSFITTYDASSFITAGTDSGRSGISNDLYEGTIKLTDKYVKRAGDWLTGEITIQDGNITNPVMPAVRLKPSGINGNPTGAGLDVIMDEYTKFYTVWGEKLHLESWSGFDYICSNTSKQGTKFSVDEDGHVSCNAITIRNLIQWAAVKVFYVADLFQNNGENTLSPGDLVKLSTSGVMGYTAVENSVPIISVELSDTAEDQMIIGVVAGKIDMSEDFKSATNYQVKQDVEINKGEYLTVVTLGAFSFCKVDASSAPIKVGDLLTSSSNPGYAMKAVNPKLGTIIGKALESASSGTKVISVMVQAR